eukprot:g29945.t1
MYAINCVQEAPTEDFVSCEKFIAPPFGHLCKSCQKSKKHHRPEALEGGTTKEGSSKPSGSEATLHVGCDLYVKPPFGNKCKQCQKCLTAHRPEVQQAFNNAGAAEPTAAVKQEIKAKPDAVQQETKDATHHVQAGNAESAPKTEEHEFVGCSKYIAPPFGHLCKSCQKAKKSHKPEALTEVSQAGKPEASKPTVTATTTAECEEYVKPAFGNNCKTCHKALSAHRPEVQEAFQKPAAISTTAETTSVMSDCAEYIKPPFGTKCKSCQKSLGAHRPDVQESFQKTQPPTAGSPKSKATPTLTSRRGSGTETTPSLSLRRSSTENAAKPVETAAQAKPEETAAPAQPVETAAKAMETAAPANPVETVPVKGGEQSEVANCSHYEAPPFGHLCKACQKPKKVHSPEALSEMKEDCNKKPETVPVKGEEESEVANCSRYEAPPFGHLCKACQKAKKLHSPEALSEMKEDSKKPAAISTATKTVDCGEYVKPPFGTRCKICQKSLKVHREEVQEVFRKSGASEPSTPASSTISFADGFGGLEMKEDNKKPATVSTANETADCGEFVKPTFGTKCKTCQKSLTAHREDVQEVFQKSGASEPSTPASSVRKVVDGAGGSKPESPSKQDADAQSDPPPVRKRATTSNKLTLNTSLVASLNSMMAAPGGMLGGGPPRKSSGSEAPVTPTLPANWPSTPASITSSELTEVVGLTLEVPDDGVSPKLEHMTKYRPRSVRGRRPPEKRRFSTSPSHSSPIPPQPSPTIVERASTPVPTVVQGTEEESATENNTADTATVPSATENNTADTATVPTRPRPPLAGADGGDVPSLLGNN